MIFKNPTIIQNITSDKLTMEDYVKRALIVLVYNNMTKQIYNMDPVGIHPLMNNCHSFPILMYMLKRQPKYCMDGFHLLFTESRIPTKKK